MKATAKTWDSYDAYLFDIDGTLLHCTDAVHYFAFCDALTSVAGRAMNLDGVVAHGNTDVGILRDAFARAGVPDAVWRPRLSDLQKSMCAQVEQHQQELCIQVLPCVTQVLAHLRQRGVILGVATGNLEGIGTLKLKKGGLLKHFHFGSYSDPHEFRTDVFASALSRARTLAGANACVCAVGDTPADVQAAKANGIDVIAVATGVYTLDELAAEQPTRCITSFADLLPESLVQ